MAGLNVIFSIIFTAFLFGNLAYAAPGIPNRFHGSVNFLDGPAPDSTVVEAKINGITVASTVTISGKYGYVPNIFDVTDLDNNRAGKTVSFFVSGTDTGETAVFTNGKSTELDLTVDKYISTSQSSSDQTDTGGGNAGSSSSAPACKPSWSCDNWSSCVNGIQTRSCEEVNNCVSTEKIPALNKSCVTPISDEKKEQNTPDVQEEKKQPYAPTGLFASAAANSGMVVGVILIIVAVVMYVGKKFLPVH